MKLLKFLSIVSSKMHRARVWLFAQGLGKFGARSTIAFPVRFEGKKYIEIGDDVSINAFAHIWGHGGVKIGDRVLIATHTAITSLTHDYTREDMRFAPVIAKPVVIDDDVWIGSNVVIHPGVYIGRGAVIGSGSVVTKDIPAYAVAYGQPCRVIKFRTVEGSL